MLNKSQYFPSASLTWVFQLKVTPVLSAAPALLSPPGRWRPLSAPRRAALSIVRAGRRGAARPGRLARPPAGRHPTRTWRRIRSLGSLCSGVLPAGRGGGKKRVPRWASLSRSGSWLQTDAGCCVRSHQRNQDAEVLDAFRRRPGRGKVGGQAGSGSRNSQ